MSKYHCPDATTLQSLRDMAHKLRIDSINATQASNSGWVTFCSFAVISSRMRANGVVVSISMCETSVGLKFVSGFSNFNSWFWRVEFVFKPFLASNSEMTLCTCVGINIHVFFQKHPDVLVSLSGLFCQKKWLTLGPILQSVRVNDWNAPTNYTSNTALFIEFSTILLSWTTFELDALENMFFQQTVWTCRMLLKLDNINSNVKTINTCIGVFLIDVWFHIEISMIKDISVWSRTLLS